MEDFVKGAKRKCTQCSTLFFDFGKFPIICPNCGYELTSLLTNVSKRGRPPKNTKPEETIEEKEIKHCLKQYELHNGFTIIFFDARSGKSSEYLCS